MLLRLESEVAEFNRLPQGASIEQKAARVVFSRPSSRAGS